MFANTVPLNSVTTAPKRIHPGVRARSSGFCWARRATSTGQEPRIVGQGAMLLRGKMDGGGCRPFLGTKSGDRYTFKAGDEKIKEKKSNSRMSSYCTLYGCSE
jgi:hypothetical protein